MISVFILTLVLSGVTVKPHESSGECLHHLPFPDHTDCTKYYVCAPWGAQIMDCAPGTHFNAAIHVCDWPENAKCIAITTTERIAATTTSITLGTSQNDTSNNTQDTEAVNEASRTTEQTTTTTCNNDLPFPHSSDCTKYYVCAPWGKQIMDCAPGTHFNPLIHVCDWPENAKCITTTTEKLTTQGTSSSVASNTTQDTTTEAVKESARTTEQSTTVNLTTTCNNNLPFSHSSDCTKYYVCAPWGIQIMDCAPGTHFNPAIHVCDWPENANCSATSTISTTTNSEMTITSSSVEISTTKDTSHDNASSQNTTEVPAESSETTGQKSTVDVTSTVTSPKPCTSDLPFSHPTDCTKYYVCSPWGIQILECAPGTYFNPVIHVCDWSVNSKCTATSTTVKTTVTEIKPTATSAVTLTTQDNLHTEVSNNSQSTTIEASNESSGATGQETQDITTSTVTELPKTTEQETSVHSTPPQLTTTASTTTIGTSTVTLSTTASITATPQTELSSQSQEVTTQIIDKTTTDLTSTSTLITTEIPTVFSISTTTVDNLDTSQTTQEATTLAQEETSIQFGKETTTLEEKTSTKTISTTSVTTEKIPEDSVGEISPGGNESNEDFNGNYPDPPSSPETICGQQPYSLFLAAHPDDCSRFIVCSFGTFTIMSCNKEMFFNPVLSGCVSDPSVCSSK